MRKIIATTTLALSLSACSWVQVTTGGQAVRLVQTKNDVSGCKELGATNTAVMSKFFIERDQDKVARELADLARNTAAELGGDTIVPISAIDDGKRTFGVYKCVNPR
jgi:hypothetical protein